MAVIKAGQRQPGQEGPVQSNPDPAQREIRKLSEALRLCQRELAQVREREELLMEQNSRWRTESTNAQAVSAYLAEGLAAHLSRAYWDIHEPRDPISWRRFLSSRWRWLGRTLRKRGLRPAMVEAEHTKLIESSPLFHAAWYLAQHADVALAGINPATHYLQCGAREGRDPSPGFSTLGYLADHPECEQSGTNPLIHYIQAGAHA